MRKIVLLFCVLLGGNCIVMSQITVGLRENVYGSIEYDYNSNIGAKIEHSIYTEVLKYQQIKLSGLFRWNVLNNNLRFRIEPYYGMTYNRSFYEYGGYIDMIIHLGKHFSLNGIANPQYDSYYKEKFFYQIGGEFYFVEDKGVVVQYSTIPLYRTLENRFNFGVHIKEGNFDVCPMLTMPPKWNAKHMRVSVNVCYTIKKKEDTNGK